MEFEQTSYQNLSKWFSFVKVAKLMSRSPGDIQVKYRKQFAEIVEKQADLYFTISKVYQFREALLFVAANLRRGLEWSEEEYLEQYRVLMKTEEEFNKTL